MFNKSLTVPNVPLFKKRIVAFIVKKSLVQKNEATKYNPRSIADSFAVAVINSKNLINSMASSYRYSPDRYTFERFVNHYHSARSDFDECMAVLSKDNVLYASEFDNVYKLTQSHTNTLKKYIKTLTRGGRFV